MAAAAPLTVEHTTIIQAAPARVIAAFFDADDLHAWWQVIRSVTVPRPLGTFAVEWASTAYRDAVLGPLGGAFHGVVVDYRTAEFFLGDVYWQPPEGESIGPMALEVRCRPQGAEHISRVYVRQTGEGDGLRWRRYFEVMAAGWQRALADLKEHLDRESLRERL